MSRFVFAVLLCALSMGPAMAALGLYQDYVVRVPVPPAVLLGLLGMSVSAVRLRKFT